MLITHLSAWWNSVSNKLQFSNVVGRAGRPRVVCRAFDRIPSAIAIFSAAGLACVPGRSSAQAAQSSGAISGNQGSEGSTQSGTLGQTAGPTVPGSTGLVSGNKPPKASSETPTESPPKKNQIIVELGDGTLGPNNDIDAADVTIKYLDATITADKAVGSMDHEVVLSGHAHLVGSDIEAFADAIHAFPRANSYRLDNARGVVDPALLGGQLLDRLYLNGGEILGNKTGYLDGQHTSATTCIEPHHHYYLRAADVQVYPHERMVLHTVSFFLFDVKVLTIPYLVIPLDRDTRKARSNYLPEFGQNSIEGYYARFPYEFAEKSFAATFLRLDFTQNLGEGYRVEQEYLAGKQPSYFNTGGGAVQGGFTGATSGTIANAYGYGNISGHGLTTLGTGLGPQSGGLFAMQGYFNSGFDSNFNASFKHQQSIGGDNKFSISVQRQANSAFSLGESVTQSTQLTFDHTDPSHGVSANFNLGLNSNDNGGTASNQVTATLHEAYDFDIRGASKDSFNYSVNYNSSTNTNNAGQPNFDTASIDSQFQLQHIAKEYTLGISANKSLNLDPSSTTTGFGTLERLPEILFSTQTINYNRGYFAKLPAELDIGVGRYSEPGHENNTRLDDDRISFLFKLQDITIMRGNTEMTTNASYEQRFYSDTAAQYEITNTTRLRQHLGGRSGFDLTYNYAQPEGETPFFFDVFQRVHNITAEGGYLDDNHFQATLGTGYNFLKDYQTAPWQTVSTRMMYRPNPRLRFDTVATYDVNMRGSFSI